MKYKASLVLFLCNGDGKHMKTKKESVMHISIEMFSLISIIFIFGFQLVYSNPFASTWDQVDFALALSRYDIMAMQPHFPGYPYFILGGDLIHYWIKSPSEALTIFNVLFYSSVIFPLFKLFRKHLTKDYSLLLTAIIYTGSYCLTMVNQPMSEGAAMAALWWYFWSIQFAFETKKKMAILFPLFIFSVLLGIRLSYIPFAVGILYLFFKKWKEKQFSIKQMIMYTIIALLFQLVWVTAVAFTEGGWLGFLKLALSFTSGHFQDWGGAVSSVDPSLFSRAKTFLFNNIYWTGISSHSRILMVLYSIVLIIFLVSFKWQEMRRNVYLHLPLVLFFCYFIWSFLAQNIDKPRHILPLSGFILFFVFLVIFTRKRTLKLLFLSVIILMVQTYQAASLINEQATEPPAVYQAVDYLKKFKQPFIVYTWEETRVFEYLDVRFPHKRVLTYQVFLHDVAYYPNRTVILTDKVVKGFKQQGIEMDKDIKKLEKFDSNILFDPVYNEVTLYQWKNDRGVKKIE